MTILHAIRAEWTKLATLPSTGWLMLVTVVVTVGISFAITGSLDYQQCESPCVLDTTKLALAGIRVGQVGVVVLAVLAVTAEYSTRTIQPTLAAVPRRFPVVLGKLAALTVLGMACGVLAVAGSLIAARTMLPGNGFTAVRGFPATSLADDLTVRAAAGTVVYLGLIGLLGAGIGLLLRDTAGAVTATLALLYAAPVVAMLLTDPKWQHRLHRFAPMDAGLAIQATRNFQLEHIEPWNGLGILSLYAAAATAAGLILFQLRDAH